MPVQMVCPRDYTLRSKLGHTISFKAGEPTSVPDACYFEAMAKNIVPVERKDTDGPAFELAHAEITGTLRDALIYQTIHEVVVRNASEDFTGGGVPKAAVITGMIGIAVAAAELGKYYQNYRQFIANNEELPAHPQMHLVTELQALATRKQLEEFAEQIGMPMPKTKGRSNKELKGLLLYAVVNQQMMEAATPDKDEYVPPKTLTQD